MHVLGVAFVHDCHLGQIALAGCALVLQQVILESFAAHNFAAAGGSETLGGCFASFQFGHGLSLIGHNRQSYHGLACFA